MTDVIGRRQKVRTELTAEIKERAWTLMADAGSEALSLREVARQMGMAPSAIYTYFSSRNDLLTALIVDGFNSLADALSAAYETRSPADSGFDACLAVARAHRDWALAHPTQYRLIYSTAIPGYQGTSDTVAASLRSADVLLSLVSDLLGAGQLLRDCVDDPEYEAQLSTWSADGGHELPTAALAAAMRWYVTLHGLINLEMNGHYPPPLQHSSAMFDVTMQAVTADMIRRGSSGYSDAPVGNL